MRKYYFAYQSVYGLVFPFMWAEDNGVCVGGRPNPIEGTVVEISPEEFDRGELSPLEKEFPYKGDLLDIAASPDPPSDST
jgi:hypothetical protein